MSWLDSVMVLLVLSDLAVLGSSRLGVYVRLAALQGVLVAAVPLLGGHLAADARMVLIVGATVAVKSVLFPWLMARIMRDFAARREEAPFLGYTAALFFGVLGLGVALWISRRLPVPDAAAHPYTMPAALFSIFTGLILIMTRRKAVTQALGYLVMENGIYVVGMLLVPRTTFLVELGVLLDVLVAVFLMGILIFHIQREFDHIDTDRLAALKE